MFTIIETPIFTADAKGIWSEAERGEFCAWLSVNPTAGIVIAGSGGCRKVRWSRQGTGKSAGVRVIYFNRLERGVILIRIRTCNNMHFQFTRCVMARTPQGHEHILSARALLGSAKTADEVRIAQSVLLPLELNLSLSQTAQAIGRSVTATCNMRSRFCKTVAGNVSPRKSKKDLRNRASLTLVEERDLLREVLVDADSGGVIIIPPLKEKIEAKLAKKVHLSTIYRMLARNGFRKISPRKSHPKGDASRREDWKKNSANCWAVP